MILYKAFFKRCFDFFVSLVGVVLTFPIVLVSIIIASFEIRGNGLFFQKRVGRNGKIFYIVKVKTMKNIKKGKTRSSITSQSAIEITKSGRLFRKYKIDELPQLWNILLGDMSFVGPRPDVPGYADCLVGEDRIILSLRPGITGPASLKYRNEEALLSQKIDAKNFNDNVIWPDKVKINKAYAENFSFFQDLKYIIQTIKG